MIKCPCDKQSTEERIREMRDGSVLIKASHLHNSPPHTFHEWPNLSSFIEGSQTTLGGGAGNE
jgi:hypothetical protein